MQYFQMLCYSVCYVMHFAHAQDSKFPKDTGINPRLADVKDQKNTRNYRMTLTIPAHSLAVSRLTAYSDYFEF